MVLMTEEGQVKLLNNGLVRMTNSGITVVAFSLTIPEIFRLGTEVDQVSTTTEYKGDFIITVKRFFFS